MGGMGSGRHWHYGAKNTTSDYLAIDVRRWHRDGFLTPHQTFSWKWSREHEEIASIQVRTETDRVILAYRHRNKRGNWMNESYSVWLDWSLCNFGGQRPWFLCPSQCCGRRVALLYGGRIFACRQCYQLAYASQRETWSHRAIRRADRIRNKLGWEVGIINGNGSKPKGMHWKTFERLTTQHDAFVELSFAGIAARLRSVRRIVG